jgi:hypothetical protein
VLPPSWRAIRAWIAPQRWWPELQALIDSVAAGCGLHPYIPN